MTVRYPRHNPAAARPEDARQRWVPVLLTGLAAVAIIAFAGWILRRKAGAWWRAGASFTA